jgi:phosphatidylethanolamine/phosphatidyl-N-methylethanolamine N-methyltransferase
MKNRTNVTKYKLLSPVYNLLMDNALFLQARKRAFSLLPHQPGQHMLLVGVGTGGDLPFVPDDAIVTGIDLSSDMLRQAKQKANAHTTLLEMNAEQLAFTDETFDVTVLHLILSVVEHPEKALAEALRVTKPGGTILVFDKFLKENRSPSILRSLFNIVTSLIGTDINRSFSTIRRDLPVRIIKEQAVLGGAYTIFVCKKPVA